MAFIVYEPELYDQVSFYQRKDFREHDHIQVEYIERGDTTTKLLYIKQHMDTVPKEKRPDTPAMPKLIMPVNFKPSSPS